MKIARYFHTLRHLRPVQITGRLWHRLNPAKPDLRAAPSLSLAPGQWANPADRHACMLAADAFRFLNAVGRVQNCTAWNDPSQEKLWLYNLHYFDDLNAVGAADRTAWHRGLVARWVAENPPAIGNGWEPYPTSLRIVNWVKWSLAGNELDPTWVHSLSVQARWLQKHIEWHLLGNHLFVNAKALVFSGLFFAGDEADAWLAQGLNILDREVPEQVLPDGAHFELSPMYHAIILEDLLDLVNAVGVWPGRVPDAMVAQWREVAERMLRWLEGMIHPDDEIAFFNDAALGIAPKFWVLSAYAKRLGIGQGLRQRCALDDAIAVDSLPHVCASEAHQPIVTLQHFRESGYVRLEGSQAVALLDVACVGPDYLPGHAHADTLSFELSVHGQRVVVNGGTSRYGLGPERLRERGTAAHSTVLVGGQDSSEVWGGFRVARRAYPFDLQIQDEAGVLQVACSHDGYKRLPGAPVHRRTWAMNTRSLQVTDSVIGGTHTALARYILHPTVTVVAIDSNTWQLTLPGSQTLRVVVSVGLGRVEPASYAPEFGVVLPTQSLTVELAQGQAQLKWFWN
jgi:uncharacterized heparinase superfamily protein